MNIHVILYSDLKAFAPSGSGRFDLTLPPGATLGDALALIRLPEKQPITALINGKRAVLESRFTASDTLVIFPEICGG